jgi:catalase
MASMFKKGAKCGLTTRFSTVGRESGSSDLARDPRGFSVKFRTDEGNWDFVANNTPVFFRKFSSFVLCAWLTMCSPRPSKVSTLHVRRINEGIWQDLVLIYSHTQKRDPATHLSGDDDATAFWDYLAENPESIHQVMILMGDRGIPKGTFFTRSRSYFATG